MRWALTLCLVATVAVGILGCDGTSATTPPATRTPATQFDGATAGGVLVAVDFDAFDPLSMEISRALLDAPRPVALAVVARVDDTRPVPGPLQLVATTTEGRVVPLVDAAVVLRRIDTSRSRRARRVLGGSAPGTRRTRALQYLAAVDVRSDTIVGVRLTVGGEVAELEPRSG